MAFGTPEVLSGTILALQEHRNHGSCVATTPEPWFMCCYNAQEPWFLCCCSTQELVDFHAEGWK